MKSFMKVWLHPTWLYMWYNNICETNANDKEKIDDLRAQAKHAEMVLQHFYYRFD